MSYNIDQLCYLSKDEFYLSNEKNITLSQRSQLQKAPIVIPFI